MTVPTCCECGRPLAGADLEVYNATAGEIDIHLDCTGLVPIAVLEIK